MSAANLIADLRAHADPAKAAILASFFKTGPGQYGEGDRFLGLPVPLTRRLIKTHRDLPPSEIVTLLRSEFHEVRLASILILVDRYTRTGDPVVRQGVFDFYLKHARRVNNWDLVDLSAPGIVGAHLLDRDPDLLEKLADSPDLWERRIAIVATFAFIRAGRAEPTFTIARRLMHDRHDLIHKATGWMLREVGKRVSPDTLRDFLRAHAATLPRTTLRYAIERFPADERARWLAAR